MIKKPASLFVGHKSVRAIPVSNHQRRDFLIQSTLDPTVRSIEYHFALRVDESIQQIDALVLATDAGRFAVDLVDARPACDPLAEGLLHLAFAENCTGIMVTGEGDIRREPRFSSCREVWRHRGVTINTDDRAAILAALDHEGPIPLRSFSGLVQTQRDIETIVYALACDGELALDLHTPLDDRIVVRTGARQRGAFGQLAYGT